MWWFTFHSSVVSNFCARIYVHDNWSNLAKLINYKWVNMITLSSYINSLDNQPQGCSACTYVYSQSHLQKRLHVLHACTLRTYHYSVIDVHLAQILSQLQFRTRRNRQKIQSPWTILAAKPKADQQSLLLTNLLLVPLDHFGGTCSYDVINHLPKFLQELNENW